MQSGIETYGPDKLRLRSQGIQIPEGPLCFPNTGGADNCIEVFDDPNPDVVTSVLVEEGRYHRHISEAVGSLAGMNLVAQIEANPTSRILRITES